MCGICGMVTPSDAPSQDVATLQRMNDVLTHRGPDGDGMYADGPVTLGHRRLSIIDLDAGAQPMFNEDKSLVIVFNGEIYNYLELIPELKQNGHYFATTCDTEVILHLYEEMGPSCVEKLNGMFAFALWDAKRQRLMLARDRLGEKPLFYHFANRRLVFASELKALLEHVDIARRLSQPALDDFLAYGYVPDGRCIIEGVAKLPPASVLVWGDGRIQVRRYWDVSFEDRDSPDEQNWIDELEHRIRESIRIRLRSDVPLGILLSGGLDSSAVLALASQVSSSRIRTFSVGFDVGQFDELAFARQMADRYQTDHTEIVVRDCDISILADLVYHLDEPFADPSALPTYHVCREARRHVTVCLSGDGGDEVFAGYKRYVQALKHQRFDSVSRYGARQLAGVVSGALPTHAKGTGFLTRVASDGADRYFSQCAKFTSRERRELLRPDMHDMIQEDGWLFKPYFADRCGSALLAAMQHCDQRAFLPDDILVKVDRMSMQSSLEVRVPFLDHTLVEFVNRAPANMKLRAGVGKYALRRLASRILPPDILSRPKMGFGIPLEFWLRGDQETFVRDTLFAPDTRCTQWIRRDAIERLLDVNRRRRRNLVGRKVWSLLVLELWCRRFEI